MGPSVSESADRSLTLRLRSMPGAETPTIPRHSVATWRTASPMSGPMWLGVLLALVEHHGATVSVDQRSRGVAGHARGVRINMVGAFSHNWLARLQRGTSLLSGDAMHSPLQVYRPDWNSGFCLDAEGSIASLGRCPKQRSNTTPCCCRLISLLLIASICKRMARASPSSTRSRSMQLRGGTHAINASSYLRDAAPGIRTFLDLPMITGSGEVT